jgi:hypothetical protein
MGTYLPHIPLLSVQPLSAREDNGQKIPPFQREAVSHRPRPFAAHTWHHRAKGRSGRRRFVGGKSDSP